MTEVNEAKRQRPKWMILAFVGVIAVVLGTGLGLLLSSTATGGTGPSDAVLRFYTALSKNNAKQAISLLAKEPDDTSFLTDAVLKAAHDQAALTEIQVPATSSTSVTVSYRLGTDSVTDKVSVVAVGNTFRILTPLNGGTGVQVGALRQPGVSMFVSGKEVTSSSITLFPGTYPLTTSSPNLSYGQSQTLNVQRFSDSVSMSDYSLQVTAAGQDAVKKAVKDSLASCVSQHSFTPTGCPFKYVGQHTTTVDETESTWVLLNRPEELARIRVAVPDVKLSTVEVPLQLRITFPPGSAQASHDLSMVQAIASVDLLSETPVIVWKT